MEILCPNCQRKLTILEQYAGQTMKCPLCANTFTAPALPSTSAVPAAPPPTTFGLPPQPPPASAPPPAAGGPPPEMPPATPTSPPIPEGPPPELALKLSIKIDPYYTQFLPAAGLFLVFLLTFFKWGNTWTAESQQQGLSAWRIGFGDNLSIVLLLYLVLLPLNLLIAIPITAVGFIQKSLPPQIQPLLRWRWMALAAATCATFLLLILFEIVGYRVQIGGAELGSIPVFWTFWYRCAFWLHFWAVVFVFVTMLADLRGPRQCPRVDVLW